MDIESTKSPNIHVQYLHFSLTRDAFQAHSGRGILVCSAPMQNDHLSNIQFNELDLPPELLQSIEDAGFSACTPIQAETLPLTLEQKDVAGQAQTGTGKTMAFLIACFAQLLSKPASEQRKPNQPRAFVRNQT